MKRFLIGSFVLSVVTLLVVALSQRERLAIDVDLFGLDVDDIE